MTGNQPEDPEYQALLAFLAAQRGAVLSIVAGLDEEAWQRPAVPSGWTPAGLVQHLGDAERHWFQGVVAGSDTELPWDQGRLPYDPEAAFACDRPSAEVIGLALVGRNPVDADDPDPDCCHRPGWSPGPVVNAVSFFPQWRCR